MKKLSVLLAIVALSLAVPAVYAGDWDTGSGNGITIFTSVALDDGSILAAGPAAEADAMEGSAAGGLRPDKEYYNGITDFGDARDVGPGAKPGKDVMNGVTLFDSRSVDDHL